MSPDSRPPLSVLAGVRVLSFTQFLMGPSAVQTLADLGADVIKIEPPGGTLWERNYAGCDLYLNDVSVFFLLAHRNQRSLTLDLKQEAGREVARRLIAEADVLVQNFRPGVMERWGLGWDEAHALNPRLIYASASGYGDASPYRDRPGQDLLMQGLSGLAWLSGRAGEAPTPVGAPIIDQHGATLLALGVLAAIIERGRTGQGLRVEASLLRASLDLQLEPVSYFLNGARLEKSETEICSMFHPAPYGVYETSDGHVIVSISPFRALADALALPELAALADAPRRFHAREDIARAIAPVLKTRTTAGWLDFFAERGVWAAPIQTYAETFADPAVQASDAVEETVHPVAGPVRVLRFPVELSTGRAGLRRPPPGCGEHTEEILRAAGYGDAEIVRLRAAAVI